MSTGKITVIGLGPGARDLLAPRALQKIQAAEVVVGYNKYIAEIADLCFGKIIVATGMRAEVERCRKAVIHAREGREVAVVCSGDAGVYGMSGLIYELLGEEKIPVEIVPGITAASAAGAVLGAPLMNDFAVVSLSDQLTPREEIVRRLRAIAEADLVCALYNPQSASRVELLAEALKIFRDVRGEKVPVGFVKHASRAHEEIWTGTLDEFPTARVDMSTIVVIGNSQTVLLGGKIVTRRGYKLE
jgi:precorrin-3B C17-methyltransferase